MIKKQNDPIKAELKEFIGDKFLELPSASLESFLQYYRRVRKTDIIYLFWFFNFHYAYVGRWWLFLLFFFTIGGFGIWWLIDLFRLNTILRKYNTKKAEEFLNNLDNK